MIHHQTDLWLHQVELVIWPDRQLLRVWHRYLQQNVYQATFTDRAAAEGSYQQYVAFLGVLDNEREGPRLIDRYRRAVRPVTILGAFLLSFGTVYAAVRTSWEFWVLAVGLLWIMWKDHQQSRLFSTSRAQSFSGLLP